MREQTAEARGPAREPQMERVFGLAATRAVLKVRPEDVRHIAHTPEARRSVAEHLRAAASHRIAYREVPREELERISGSLHHEGICMQVAPRRTQSLTDLARSLKPRQFVLALDGVDNPHNIGALMRSAGFFGARGMVVGARGSEREPSAARERETRLPPSTVRVAEGAAEYVPVCFVHELSEALDCLREAGASVIGADAHEGVPHAQLRWPEKAVLVLGSEHAGLTPAVKKRCSGFVHIQGQEAVESLNVSVAAGILMAAISRSHS